MPLFHGTDVATCYIIASLQRTGSYLLCEALANTGVAGRPIEPFSAQNKVMHRDGWGLDPEVPFDQYIAEVVRHGTTKNGVFGIKVHWSQIEYTRKWLGIGTEYDQHTLQHLFPDALYIHLTRHDVRGQAISSYRAEKTNEWWRLPDVFNPQIKAPDPPYDSSEIRRWEGMFRQRQADWLRYFTNRKIVPLHVDYDDLANDWRKETARVLEFLGQDARAVDDAPEPKLIRQADALTRAWRRRLDAEDATAAPGGSSDEATEFCELRRSFAAT